MIAAIYARVSTADQKNALQIAELTKYARKNRWKYHVFEDQMTGARNDRPGLSALMEAARARLVDVVLVWKLDRFGRSAFDLHSNIRELEALGIRFLAVTQGIDTDQANPVSRFLLSILGAVAELEREMIGERVRFGIARAKAAGVKFGRSQRVFNRDKAFELRQSGLSLRAIARTLEVGTGTIQRLLAPVPETPGGIGPAARSKVKGKPPRRRCPKG